MPDIHVATKKGIDEDPEVLTDDQVAPPGFMARE